MLDRCDLWVNLDTPELKRSGDGGAGAPSAFLRFEATGLIFGLPDLPASSEGRVHAIPVLWSDALGLGLDAKSFSGDIKLCFEAGNDYGWRCTNARVLGIDAEGSGHPVSGTDAASKWLTAPTSR